MFNPGDCRVSDCRTHQTRAELHENAGTCRFYTVSSRERKPATMGGHLAISLITVSPSTG